MTDGLLVYVIKYYYGGGPRIERRRLLGTVDAGAVRVSAALMPAGEVVNADAVFGDWPAAVAAYWESERARLGELKRQVKALEKRIAAGKEPRILNR